METYPAPPIDPSLVGKAFVRQYYTQMHKDPNSMHRFYLDQSSFVYGGSEMGSEEPVLGQKAIHDKIMSLDLQQVHAKIKQVDSYSTLGNGIVIQVTGELSVRGRPMRAFVQTFVLGQDTPKKYYVHNDIFRYQDDDLVSESETNENPEEGGETTPQPLMNVGEYTTAEPEVNQGSYEAPQVEPHPQEPADLPPGNWEYTGTEVTENGLDTPTVGEFPTATDPIEPEHHEEPFSPADQSVEAESKGPSTWASRLAKQSGSRPLNSTAIPTSQALPQREPRPPRRQSDSNRPPQNPPPTNTAANKDKKTTPPNQDSSQIFVGGLPPGAKEIELRDVFEKFGKVRDVRMNPKNFAFVEFEDPGCVKKVMNLKSPVILGSKNLNIEPKRSQKPGGPRGDRDRPPRDRGVGGGKPRGGKPPKR